MTDPIEMWHSEHVYFLALLRLLEKQIDILHRGEEPPYELMADIVSYLRDYSDHSHHPREDVAFERLAQYCPDLELVLSRLQQEHRIIAYSGAQLLEQLQAVIGGSIVPREQIESAAATYLVYYKSHISKEEKTVIASAAKHLTSDDWVAVKKVVPIQQDPLFGENPQARYRALREQINLHAAETA